MYIVVTSRPNGHASVKCQPVANRRHQPQRRAPIVHFNGPRREVIQWSTAYDPGACKAAAARYVLVPDRSWQKAGSTPHHQNTAVGSTSPHLTSNTLTLRHPRRYPTRSTCALLTFHSPSTAVHHGVYSHRRNLTTTASLLPRPHLRSLMPSYQPHPTTTD